MALLLALGGAAACGDDEAGRPGAVGDRPGETVGAALPTRVPDSMRPADGSVPAGTTDGSSATAGPGATGNDTPVSSPASSDPARTGGSTSAAGGGASGATGGAAGGSGGSSGARPAAADSILRLAARAYGEVRSLQAEFRQRTSNPLLGRTTTSRGTLFQRRPDRFLMRFSEPPRDRIVSDGTHIWVYYPSVDEKQVIQVPAGAGGAGAVDLQAQFLGDPMRRFDATLEGRESVGGRPAMVLTLRPRDGAGFRSLKVWIDERDHLVRRFEIVEQNDVVRHFELSGLRTGVSLGDELFRFTPPEGAHVVSRG